MARDELAQAMVCCLYICTRANIYLYILAMREVTGRDETIVAWCSCIYSGVVCGWAMLEPEEEV